ncbi:MAG: PPOX class F420-dependent oxidoreductase [Actinomycetota bacterium]|nr:PPOX class F420-dependent oxidoreductase [Actinomycetota bacterium]MDQ3642449.1 PPOX class F420-dependent oxidoreductase [Actinomycetota bacterium]
MSLTTTEQQYLETQVLGRLATARADGSLQNNPVGFSYDETTGTINITGRNLGATQKFRNVASTGMVALVVDDIVSRDPWAVRGVEVRGRAEARRDQEPPNPYASREVIRIHPHRVISWGLDPANPGMNSREVGGDRG